MEDKKNEKTKKSIWTSIGRLFLYIVLTLLCLSTLIILLIQTPPVQDFARKKIVSFLENKLQTKVVIGHLDIDFPKMLVLEGVYIEDHTKDTLLAGNQLKVDIDMLKLLKSEIQINEINLNGITAKVKRPLSDTTFNFQFILAAFASKKDPAKKDTAVMKMAIEKIIVDKTRLVYMDVVTGNDVDIYINHLDTRIKTFDLTNLKYEVPIIVVNGLRGTIKQTKPLSITVVTNKPNTSQKQLQPSFLNFINHEIKLKDIDIAYTSSVSSISTKIKFNDLTIHPELIDMEHTSIAIKDITLNGLNGFLKMDKDIGDTATVVKLTTENGSPIKTNAMPWKFTVGSIKINNNNFVFDDNTKPKQIRGMDYAHLGLNDVTLHAEQFLFHLDTIATNITLGSMQEKSGFVLNKFKTKVLYTAKGASFENIFIKTPGSEIKRSISVRYPSLAAIQKDLGLLEMNINMDNSFLQVKDILNFVPMLSSQPGFSNPNATMYLNSKVSGFMNRLIIETLQFRGLRSTNVDVSGVVMNAIDSKKVIADLTIKTFTTSSVDIALLAPKGSIPTNITIPENISVTGTVKGNMKIATANLAINTSLGNANIKGTISDATDKLNTRYTAAVSLAALDLGALTKQPQSIGKVSASFIINGKGFDPEKTHATVKGKVMSAEVMQYSYRNLKLDARIAGKNYTAKADIADPNIDLTLNAKGNLGDKLPGVFFEANIDSIKTFPLHLTVDPIMYHGKITADVPAFNLDDLNGVVHVVHSVLVMKGQRITMDTVTLAASNTAGQQVIDLKTDFMNALLKGKFKPGQLADILFEAIQKYYVITTPGKLKEVSPYDFTITANIIDHPILHGFIPDLKRFDGLTLKANLSSRKGINATIKIPYTLLGTNAIDSVNVHAVTIGDSLNVAASLNQLKSGNNVALYKTRLTANIAGNKINFDLATKDKVNKDKYVIAGILAKESNKVFAISLKPDSLLLNYEVWTIAPNNLLRYGPGLLSAKTFDLSKGEQHLIINSLGAEANSPLAIDFKSFQIATLTSFVQADVLPIAGMLNGNLQVHDILRHPNFNADLNLNHFAVKGDTIGDLNIKVNNNTPNDFATNISITGKGNDIALTGNYYLKPAVNSDFNFKLNIRQLPFKTLEALSMGAITGSKGSLNGTVDISGKATSPKIDGGISFNQTGFNLTALGSYFTIDNETIKVSNEGIRLNTFIIKDSANNEMVIDGLGATQNFIHYNLDLTVKARNFQAINTVKKQNSLYYGKLVFNSSLKIKGTETAPVVDGSIKVTDSTHLSIVLPQAEPGMVDRNGVIKFVDMDAPGNDSLFINEERRYDASFNKSAMTGYDISANIEVSKEATFSIILDEANGDFLKMKGQALLTGGIDPSGKITLTGSYEIESGGYELSFNFIHRRFDIQKGSKITWTGDPTSAIIDVTAVYMANTSPIDLVINQISDPAQKSYYQQKLPFIVKLNMKGELMKPDLTFGIDLPKEGSNLRVSGEVLTTVNARLEQIRKEPSELNKQVFALLLLNRFVSDNPFQSSGSGGGFDATSYAKQSVSKILTEQLNKLATDLIAGVDINFDVNSEEDFTTGKKKDRTDFNVQLSKRLLSDRLKVSVGSNYELEGPQQGRKNGSNVIGNLTVDYNLTQDGRYLLRGYRKNDYDYVLEGQVTETGLKFIISADYNKVKDLFRKKKKQKKPKDNIKPEVKTADDDSSTLPEKEKDNTVLFTQKQALTDDRKTNITPVNDSTNVQ